MRKVYLLLLFSLCAVVNVSVAQISGPSVVCPGIPVKFTSLFDNSTTHAWVFDEVDISSPPGAYTSTPVSGLTNPTYASVTNDGGTWYSFVCNYAGNTLIRLDYGANPDGVPAATDMGKFGTGNIMEGIAIVRDSVTNNWHGFIVN